MDITACCYHQMHDPGVRSPRAQSPLNPVSFHGPDPCTALLSPRAGISFLRSGTRPMVRSFGHGDLRTSVWPISNLTHSASKSRSRTLLHAAALAGGVRSGLVDSGQGQRAGCEWR